MVSEPEPPETDPELEQIIVIERKYAASKAARLTS